MTTRAIVAATAVAFGIAIGLALARPWSDSGIRRQHLPSPIARPIVVSDETGD